MQKTYLKNKIFKILPLLLMLPLLFIGTEVFAATVKDGGDYYFRIDNPSVGHLYFIIFNSIAAMFHTVSSDASGGYTDTTTYFYLLRLAFTVGGFFMFIMIVGRTIKDGSHAGLFDFLKYLIMGTTLLFLMFGSKSTIVVESDTLPGSYCSSYQVSPIGSAANGEDAYSGYTVGNFPTLLAWVFTTSNQIGYQLTKMARTTFSDPSDVSAGLSSGSTEYAHYLQGINALLTTSIGDMIRDGNVTTVFPQSGTSDYANINMSQALGPYFRLFMKDCLFMLNSTDPDVGTKIQEAIESTSYFTKTMDDVFGGADTINVYGGDGNVKRTFGNSYLSSGGSAATQIFNVGGMSGSCGEFWSSVIEPAIAAVDDNTLLCSPSLAGKVDKGALYVLTGENNLPGGKTAEIAINSGLFQMYGDMKNGGYVAEDISYATGKSKADFVMNNVGTGMYMAQMLPYLQMGIRAVLYAFFPFVFVVILLPGGVQVLISYLSTLIWVELWTPVAAILNMFLGTIAANKFQAAFNRDGFNPGSALNILSDSAMLASVGGYLYASVPALTWLVLKGSGQMLGSITGAMAGGYAANLAAANINKDKSMLEKQKAVNDFSASQTGKFLSMAEIEGAQAKQAGLMEGSRMGSMINKHGSLGAAVEAMGVGAGLTAAFQDEANHAQAQHQTLEDSHGTGVQNAITQRANRVHLTQMDVLNGDGTVDKNKKDVVSNVEATQKTSNVKTSKKVQDAHGGQTKKSAESISDGKATSENAAIDSAKTIGYDKLYQNAVDSANMSRAQFDQMIKDFGGVAQFAQLSQENQDNAIKGYVSTRDKLGRKKIVENIKSKQLAENIATANKIQQYREMNGKKDPRLLAKDKEGNYLMPDNAVAAAMAAVESTDSAVQTTSSQQVQNTPGSSPKEQVDSMTIDKNTQIQSTQKGYKAVKQALEKQYGREFSKDEVLSVMAASGSVSGVEKSLEHLGLNPSNDDVTKTNAILNSARISSTGKVSHHKESAKKVTELAGASIQKEINKLEKGDNKETRFLQRKIDKTTQKVEKARQELNTNQERLAELTQNLKDEENSIFRSPLEERKLKKEIRQTEDKIMRNLSDIKEGTVEQQVARDLLTEQREKNKTKIAELKKTQQRIANGEATISETTDASVLYAGNTVTIRSNEKGGEQVAVYSKQEDGSYTQLTSNTTRGTFGTESLVNDIMDGTADVVEMFGAENAEKIRNMDRSEIAMMVDQMRRFDSAATTFGAAFAATKLSIKFAKDGLKHGARTIVVRGENVKKLNEAYKAAVSSAKSTVTSTNLGVKLKVAADKEF